MDNFAKLSPEEQEVYFLVAQSKSKFNLEILEKDFWVCWVLHRIFNLSDLKDHLTFKGGTSLSKAYKVIERFSEDIDISIEKSFLGFVDDKDPETAATSKLRNTLLKELSESCKKFVLDEFLKSLRKNFSEVLGDLEWTLEIDELDSSGQTLLFKYPSFNKKDFSYISKQVKIEMGARSDHWPTERFVCSPYISDFIEDEGLKSKTSIRVLSAERTFWEKATILHMFSHYPEDKKVPIRQSRHFYDFYCLLTDEKIFKSALADLSLLDRVAKHKSIFFRAGWAKYEDAKPNTLRLIPGKRVLSFMEKDFKDMSEMFYSTPPEWNFIVEKIRQFETKFNVV